MTKKSIILISFIGIFILVISGIYFWTCSHSDIPRGNIVLRTKSPISPYSSILVMDGNGNYIRWVGYFEGSPTWSPNGRFIAVGCENKICILDFSTMPDKRNYLGWQRSEPDIAYRLQSSELCKSNSNYGDGVPYSGILSMSWSPDGQRLAVVCGGEEPASMRSVCVLSLDGEMHCWDNSVSKDVYRVSWSPVDEDVIAISGFSAAENTSKILLVNAQGKKPVYLAHGWSPEWSPDGKQLAYIQMGPEHVGIAIINRDGTGSHWVERSTQGWSYECRGFTGTCRLSWSPDGHYLTFVSSSDVSGMTLWLYRLNIQTGDAIQLLDNMIVTYPAEPDWGP